MRCKACYKEINFVKTQNGRLTPVNPERVTIVTDKGEVVTGRISHFATCPKAGEFRKPRK